MGPFNGPTIAILVILALLLFGAKKLPDLARSLGRSARILKAESKGLVDDENEGKDGESGQQDQQAQAQGQQPEQPPQQNQQAQADETVQHDPRQLPPGQRIVNESGESAHRSYGN
ncbi:Sec-independent protein translocase subunit TatA [Nocardiopsis sp. HNM0947]|uniref:Sec-independent protein translocase protein TatA n=1 Tax=Nocardiopsis coralli TaxID=2772213 RepID=A0ABR9P1A3_9ACTN|nr:Sec-independent protein translocase subunit TatA [Nocardiopsis coralli]MBE2997631.1 Sec-independent protein translocase subunit TatA [Nocardiopsis coralli]